MSLRDSAAGPSHTQREGSPEGCHGHGVTSHVWTKLRHSADCQIALFFAPKRSRTVLVVQACGHDWFLAFVTIHIKTHQFGATRQLAGDVWRFSLPNGHDPKPRESIQNTYSRRIPSIDMSYKSFLPAILQLSKSPPKSEGPSDTDRRLDFGSNKLAKPSGIPP